MQNFEIYGTNYKYSYCVESVIVINPYIEENRLKASLIF